MQYYSTNNKSVRADFKEATIRGQAPDKGLYFPSEIPKLPKTFIQSLAARSKEEIAFEVIKPYVGPSIPRRQLETIVLETVQFDFPLVQLTDAISLLELFHGPTLAFKDVGARFMSRCLRYFMQQEQKKLTVLVATSGDTGSAVANGFYEVGGVEVVILYPSGKVSNIQEAQLNAGGKNISTLKVMGNFDDCQRMVKAAFADAALNQQLLLTSANSINLARWLPQQFYYFFAYKQWQDKATLPVLSVPSGNFGNIGAGLLAYASGLPVQHFIAACNANDTVPRFLQQGRYQPQPVAATISNAMDVGDPSNFVRILELFRHDQAALKKILSAYSISDDTTASTIQQVKSRHNYLLDPHGAVGLAALNEYLLAHPGEKGIFLETAHPVKFYDIIEPIVGEKIPFPPSIKILQDQKVQRNQIEAEFGALKSFLLNRR
jgi:threonine synthase